MAGTPILMADGTEKAIESIVDADRVMAYDLTASTRKSAPVVAVAKPYQVDHYYVVNGTIRATGNHPMLSRGQWIEVGQLRVGDPLTAADGSSLPIRSIMRVDEPVTAYNFEVGELSSYIAHGVVVHNKNLEYELYPCFDCTW